MVIARTGYYAREDAGAFDRSTTLGYVRVVSAANMPAPAAAENGRIAAGVRLRRRADLAPEDRGGTGADQPDRYEPRRKKRRPNPYDRLMKPRWKAKRDMRNGLREN
jgi:hypothetical protein